MIECQVKRHYNGHPAYWCPVCGGFVGMDVDRDEPMYHLQSWDHITKTHLIKRAVYWLWSFLMVGGYLPYYRTAFLKRLEGQYEYALSTYLDWSSGTVKVAKREDKP